jgi:hypothetical protein
MSAENASAPGNDGRPATSTHDVPRLDLPPTIQLNNSTNTHNSILGSESAGLPTGIGNINGSTNGGGGPALPAEPPFLQPSELYVPL